MKRILIVSIAVIAMVSIAQTDPKLTNHKAVEPYENIYVERISGDTNQTSFLIWVKNSVPLHLHEWHTENVYILDGKGEMTLGDEKFVVKKGDYFNIPKGTPHALKVLSSAPVKVLSIQSPHFDGSDRILISTP
jgi:quercetin dioxygenase-like cupin family protein